MIGKCSSFRHIPAETFSRMSVRFGSRLCQNSGAETFRVIIESRRWRGQFIIAAEANFMNQYFVSVAKSLFSHSLGQLQTISIL